MAGVSLECILMWGYAVSLGLLALVLEWVAGHAHKRSMGISTTGFTYHPEKDIWRCPKDQHLFPIFTDHARLAATLTLLCVLMKRLSAKIIQSNQSMQSSQDASQPKTIP